MSQEPSLKKRKRKFTCLPQDDYITRDHISAGRKPSYSPHKIPNRPHLISSSDDLLREEITNRNLFRITSIITRTYKETKDKASKNVIRKKLGQLASYYLEHKKQINADQPLLIHLANQLSKGLNQACGDACAVIALEMDLKSLRKKNNYQKFLSLLINACSKQHKQSNSKKAIKAIAEHLSADSLEGFNSQYLSTMVNGFSKWPKEGACKTVVVRIAAHLMERKLEMFDAVGLSNLAHGFSRWPKEDVCKTAVIKIASYLVAKCQLKNPNHISTLVNSFSKWPKEGACKTAAVKIATHLLTECQLEVFDPQGLSNLVNGFSKWPKEDACKAAVIAIAQHLAKRKLENFNHLGLSNLVNGFSKWPEEGACKAAVVKVAEHIVTEGQLKDFDSRELSNLVDGFSKWPEEDACKAAAVKIAEHVVDNRQLKDFSSRYLSVMLKGFGRWPKEGACKAAGVRIAKCLVDNVRMKDFRSRHLSMMVNGFGKWPKEGACKAAVIKIAEHLVVKRQLKDFNSQHLSTIVNGFSKWPEEGACKIAVVKIAEYLVASCRLKDFDSRHLSMIVNGFSKWPEENACKTAVVKIAEHLITERQLRGFNAQGLSNLVNGLSKWPEEDACKAAAVKLAKYLVTKCRLKDFNAQGLSNLVNGFSKWPEENACKTGVLKLAEHLIAERRLRDFNSLELSNLVNGFSKWPEEDACKAAAVKLAEYLVTKCRLKDFNAQGLSNLVNGLSKWPAEDACKAAVVKLAEHLIAERQLRDFNSLELSNLVNGFSKWAEEDACKTGVVKLAEHLIAERQLRDFTSQELSLLVQGFCNWPEEEVLQQAAIKITGYILEQPLSQFNLIGLSHLTCGLSLFLNQENFNLEYIRQYQSLLCKIATHLQTESPLDDAPLVSVAYILRGFGCAGLWEQLDMVASQCLPKLEQHIKNTQGMPCINLQHLGTLCMALIPLFDSIKLRRHRDRATRLLKELQPFLATKVALWNESSKFKVSKVTPENFYTCRPSLTFYQILKAYTSLYRNTSTESELKTKKTHLTRDQIQIWAKKIYSQLLLVQQNYPSETYSQSLRLIAELEAEDPLDALDELVEHYSKEIAQCEGSPAIFDVDQVFDELSKKSPEPVDKGVGIQSIPECNLRGQVLSHQARYSILSHLTGGALQPIWVKLPAFIKPQLLACTVQFRQRSYRFNVWGGSHMKPDGLNLLDLAQGKNRFAPNKQGKLLGIPLVDTLQNSSLEKLMIKLFPFKESFYYGQRALLAGGPSELKGKQDHVLAGRFCLAICPDRKPNQQHPFTIMDGGTKIALRPHDGTGFIKESLAQKMPWYPERNNIFPGPYGGDKPSGYLPADALQHYPRNEKVSQELIKKFKEKKSTQPERKPHSNDLEVLYRDLTTTSIQGYIALAVPSADDRLHLPKAKAPMTGNVLLGRAPYDKPNLRPFTQSRVSTSGQGDVTAKFLDSAWAMQYSLVGRRPLSGSNSSSSSSDAPDSALFFAKGLLVIVPDAIWPENFAGRDVVLSAEDPKTDSSWKLHKERMTIDTYLDISAILSVVAIFAPGSLIAVPIDEQQKLDGDFDGDTDLLLFDYNALYQHVEEQDNLVKASGVVNLKPIKTYTSSLKFSQDGHYQFGRSDQILATRSGVLEIFVGLQRSFLSQPQEKQQQLANAIYFEVFAGIDEARHQSLIFLLDQHSPALIKIEELIQWVSEHVTVETCHPVTRYLLADLLILLKAWNKDPVGKSSERAQSLLPDPSPSHDLQKLRPQWHKQRSAVSSDIRRCLELAVCHIPVRLLREDNGIVHPTDVVQTIKNVLSLGIKTGTDAYKSDTGIKTFRQIAENIRMVFRSYQIALGVPYSKSIIRKLQRGCFDANQTQLVLKNNPTLAAQVMSMAIEAVHAQRHLPETVTQPKNKKRKEPASSFASVKSLLTSKQRIAEENSLPPWKAGDKALYYQIPVVIIECKEKCWNNWLIRIIPEPGNAKAKDDLLADRNYQLCPDGSTLVNEKCLQPRGNECLPNEASQSSSCVLGPVVQHLTFFKLVKDIKLPTTEILPKAPLKSDCENIVVQGHNLCNYAIQ